DLVKATPDKDQLISLYGQMAFKSWLNELLEGGTGVVEADEKSGRAISNGAGKAASTAETPTKAITIDRSQYETILEEDSFN
ncbi:hypothetical protein, partial [Vibrio sp. 10N.222.49.C9]